MDIKQITEDIHSQKAERTTDWKKDAEVKSVDIPLLQNKRHAGLTINTLKKAIKSLPGFRTLVQAKDRLQEVSSNRAKIDSLHREFMDLNHRFILAQQTITSTHDNNLLLKEENRVLRQKVEALSFQNSKSTTSPIKEETPLYENRSFDELYRAFEDRFRGSEENIRDKQSKYLQLFKDLPEELRAKPIVDIGCGRGEWLEVVNQNNLNGVGVEPNESMAKEAKAKNIEVYSEGALSYFSKVKAESLGGVTSFHVVEHLELDYLFEMLQQACKSIASGGCIVLETPNPENVVVGSCNFYTDPTHLSPIPPEALRFYVEQAGFIKTDILRLSPMKKDIEIPHSVLNEMANRFFGPQDYAVIGYKT